MTAQQRVRARPARETFPANIGHTAADRYLDPPGPTTLSYTRNGDRLITAGSNDVIRVYTTGSSGEPTNIDGCPDNNLALAATVGPSQPKITLWN